jgi:8-oxo-dGTP pyrophosphatase MutT (NUDIX family)
MYLKSEKHKMRLIDKLAWIELKDKAVLVTRSRGKDKYYIPGGKREQGESDEQALCREVKEELTVDLKSNTIQFVGIFEALAHGYSDGTLVKMTCYSAKYSGILKADSEIEEIQWLHYADIEKVAHVDKLIFNFLKEKGLLV